MTDLYVQYGSGNVFVDNWLNYDASPTLRIKKIPIVKHLIKRHVNFDKRILYGDIVKGLPLESGSVKGLFASHVIEHLSYQDAKTCLKNSFDLLKPGGCFRLIVPDLAFFIDKYQKGILSQRVDKHSVAFEFNFHSGFGRKESSVGFVNRILSAFSNSAHLWMWDFQSLKTELQDAGFVDVETFEQGISEDEMFLLPERDYQFFASIGHYGLAIQAFKPR
tara:strand:+ start:4598 stop:5257 length:660 start_codon:yes stop_codon:yes gene_type:complete